MLNRGVVSARPKQPYLDWAAGLDDSEIVPDPDAEQTVYLIPRYGDDEEAWGILKKVHAEIFERELYGWHTDEAAWPKDRDFAMFKAWFEIELHSGVEAVAHQAASPVGPLTTGSRCHWRGRRADSV